MNYSPDSPPPTSPLAGFTTAATATAYPTPELAECANWAAANYPEIYGRNRQAIDSTLAKLQSESFIDPRTLVQGVLFAAKGAEHYAQENPQFAAAAGITPQSGADDPYRPDPTTRRPTLSAPVDLNRLPPSYSEVLRNLRTTPEVIDEFLSRTVVKAGLEPDLARARARFVKNVVKDADTFASDNQTLVAPVAGHEGGDFPLSR